MNQITYIIIGLVFFVLLFGAVYFLRHAKTSPKKIEKSGIDTSQLLISLGGKDNVTAVSANGSKVVFVLKDTRLVNGDGLKSLGASGVVSSKDKVSVIFGRSSDALAKEIGQIL